jgi:rhodanese-related sulfurtransferase
MSEGYAYIDVRSELEFSLGHPAGAVNVPWGSAFVDEMLERYPEDSALVLGCATGVRSLAAAHALVAAGYSNVVDQRAGMDGARDAFGRVRERGWKAEGLPTS